MEAKHVIGYASTVLFATLLLAAQESLTLDGTVLFTGKAPEARRFRTQAGETIEVSPLSVDPERRTLADVFVEIRTADRKRPREAGEGGEALLSIDDRKFSPRVLVLPVGSTLKLRNDGTEIHNAHGLPRNNADFNVALTAGQERVLDWKADHTERFEIKCDCCGWQRATIVVTRNGAVAVTGADGRFSIDGLAAGAYELRLWHPVLEEVIVPFELPADAALTVPIDAAGLDVEAAIERARARPRPERTDEERLRIDGWLRDLGGDDVEARDRAMRALIDARAADAAEPLLDGADAELRARAKRILTAIGIRSDQ